jgi:hypothetical protein
VYRRMTADILTADLLYLRIYPFARDHTGTYEKTKPWRVK